MVRDGVEAWREAYAGNVAAHHFFTAALLPLLRKGGQAIPGHSSAIINISSSAGITKTHSQGQFAYSSSKAAFLHLTKEWAHTFVPLRIRANCIAPGLFPTEMTTGTSDEHQKSHLEGAGFHFPAGLSAFSSFSVCIYISMKGQVLINWNRSRREGKRHWQRCALSGEPCRDICQWTGDPCRWRYGSLIYSPFFFFLL